MKINHVVKTLIISDFVINSGFGIFLPIFAVFIADQINGGSLEVVGYATAISQIFKSGLQIPIARYLDKNHGEYDDFYSMIFGSILIAVTPFMFLVASEPIHVYIIQALYGIGAAFAIPPWYAIFTRHVDKMKENVEWSLDSVAIGISGAGAAALGGIIAERFGFNVVFFMAGLLSTLGVLYAIKIFKDLKGSVPQGTVRPDVDKL